MKEIIIEGERKIEAKIFVPEGKGPFPGVIFHHGRGTNMKGILPVAEDLAHERVASLGLNFPNDDIVDRLKDSETSYLWFMDQSQINPDKIGISGSSMGAHTAVALASKYPIESLLLRAPAAFRNGEFDATENSETIQMIRNFTGDLMVVQSKFDDVIPAELIDLFLKNAVKARRKEKYVMKDAGHSLGEPGSPQREELKNVLIDWFTETLDEGI